MTDETKEIIEKTKSIAVIGCSMKSEKPSYYVPNFLLEKGYEIIPVNPKHKVIFGKTCYPSLDILPKKPDLALIFRPSTEVYAFVKQAVDLGFKSIWLQLGIQDDLSKSYAHENNVHFVSNKCMMVEYKKLKRF